MVTTYGSLFTGVGGLDLAIEAHYGAAALWHAEIEPGPAAVLARHWPDVPNLGDVTAVQLEDVPRVDIICGGFPCQDISYAGRGAGLDGERSGLYWHLWDAVRVLRPRVVVVENVAALLVRGGTTVVGSLAALGYDCRWGVVRASDAGAPHRRARIFLVAADAERVGDVRGRGPRRVGSDESPLAGGAPQRERARDAARDRGAAPADASHLGHERPGRARRRGHGLTDGGDAPADASGAGWGEAGDDVTGARSATSGEPRPLREPGGRDRALVDAVSDGCEGERRQPADHRHTWRDADRRGVRTRRREATWGQYWPAIARWEAITGEPAPAPTVRRRLNPDLSRWMMGLPAGWLDGLTRTQALKAAGNAVVPQQAMLALDLLVRTA